MFRSRTLLIAVLLLMNASVSVAQVPWEVPQLTAPHAPRGVSLLGASYAAAPGDKWGAVLIWRASDAPTGLGFRIAAGQGRGEDLALGAGVDVSAWIVRASQTFPLDVIWLTGIGASYGHSAQVALPIGVAAGRSLGDDAFWFAPYASSRVVIEGRFGGNAPADEFDLQIANEVGANVSFDRGRKFVLRLAAAIGDRSGFAVGGHLGAGPRAVVQAAR